MKYLKPAIGILLTIAITWALNTKLGDLPPLGKLLNPLGGFWQNAEARKGKMDLSAVRDLLHEEATVTFDERMVPHIFARNMHDLYLLQGFVTASHRLWQMDFQTLAAAGRVSEIIGEKALAFDMAQRREGMVYAAERAVESFKNDKLSRDILEAYSAGINSYIGTLSYCKLPLEYKLLDYRPEPWTELRSALLLKNMAKMLTGKDRDFEYTNAVALLGKDEFNKLFPEYHTNLDPVIPAGTPWNFSALPAAPKPIDSLATAFYNQKTPYLDEPIEGSNNWAVAASRTLNGKTLLANDPHLQLNLPSIWYEIQMHAPGLNVYGASLPGAPGVVIGFNQNIAWGVTNASWDVRDWYNIKFKTAERNEYNLDGKWEKAEKRIETIKVRGGKTVMDTVVYTKFGPVVFSAGDTASGVLPGNLALRWIAHDPSNEMLTFYHLNRAANYSGYVEALKHYNCPAQNFVFAGPGDTIALWHRGKYPIRADEQGKFIQDGSSSANIWKEYIPREQNPHVVVPAQGFVSSANQRPTDSTYPYFYPGIYENYRNRRINHVLHGDSAATPESMMKLQNDNYNLQASENVPVLLEALAPYLSKLDTTGRFSLHYIKKWTFMNNPDLIGPTFYEEWWNILNDMIWDEMEVKGMKLIRPDAVTTIELIKNEPTSKYFDVVATKDKIETAPDLVYASFAKAAVELYARLKEKGVKSLYWGNYKATGVRHIARIDAFSVNDVYCGGNHNIVNATTPTHGPSWRMVVELGENPKAWGIFPGGQSGNPGSWNYANTIGDWAAGEYYTLKFLKNNETAADSSLKQIVLKPKNK